MNVGWKGTIGGLTAALVILACGLITPSSNPEAGVATIVAETLTAATSAVSQPADTATSPSGITAEFPGGSLVIPTGLGTGITAETIPAVVGQEEGPWWELAPEHVRIAVQGYPLQGNFHKPQIVVYPAAEYAAVNESAAANILTLQRLVSDTGAVPASKDLPHITFFNAGPVFQSQVAVLPFQGGYGIRALTVYAQYAAPISNDSLFYHFQGLTSEGKYYVVAILPVTAPLLQQDSAQSSVPPAGGVPFPNFETADPAAYETYYGAMTNLLDATPAGDFSPSLASLDALIGSLSVAP